MKAETIFNIIAVFFVIYLLGHYIDTYNLIQKSFGIAPVKNSVSTVSKSASNETLNTQQGTIGLTSQTVSTHNSPADCWLIIQGNVYDATNYLTVHPGGANRIIPYCGQEATNAFITRGGDGTHSSAAYAELSSLLIGKLNENVSQSTIEQKQQTIQQQVQQLPQREREDDDDD